VRRQSRKTQLTDILSLLVNFTGTLFDDLFGNVTGPIARDVIGLPA
jgi:hypothetical protein